MSSLPERPNLGHLRRQAKELLRQYRADDPAAVAAFRQYLPAAKDKSATDMSSTSLGLRDAQSCIARQYGFASWPELKHYVEGLRPGDVQTSTSTEADNIARQRYDRAQRAYEQARPRTAVPFEPENFDKYVGYRAPIHSRSRFSFSYPSYCSANCSDGSADSRDCFQKQLTRSPIRSPKINCRATMPNAKID